MGDMTIHHQEIVIAYSGHHPTAGRAWIERDEFSNRIVVSYYELARFTFIFQILGNGADAGKLKNRVVLTNARAAFDDDLLPLEVGTEDPLRRSVRVAIAEAGLRTFAATGNLTYEGHSFQRI